MSLAAFLSILAIHLAAAISPGPSFVVSIRTAAAEGFRPAAFLAVGLGLGAVIWALAAILGLALVFEIAPMLLTALKVAGGLMLIWIAVQTWRHAADPMPEPEIGTLPRSGLAGFRLGLATQLANPKPAIFFGAVFVGLVPPGTPWPWIAALLAGILVQESLWYVLVARLFSLSRARRAYAAAKRGTDRLFGALIAGFGLKISLS